MKNLTKGCFLVLLLISLLSCGTSNATLRISTNTAARASVSSLQSSTQQDNHVSIESPFDDSAEDTGWDLNKIDTGRNADYLSELEKRIVLEVNKVRTNPSLYAAEYLVPRRKYFSGRLFKRPGEINLMTNEGINALNECIRALQSHPALNPLAPSKALSFAARDHVMDTGPKGILGHRGSDGSDINRRINRYGSWDRSIGENISYGENDAKDIVIQLIVDDGVPSRGHRKNIMASKFQYIGVSVGKHRRYGYLCVLDFASEITDKL